MKVLGRIKGVLCALMLMLTGLFISMPAAYADEVPEYRLQVSPARLDLELKPGETTTAKFKIQNTGSKAFDYIVLAAPYSVDDENYGANVEKETAYTDLAKWITFSQDKGNIEADKEQEITVTATVPKDVPAGGQYASILVRMDLPASGSDESGVDISQQVGILTYSSVDGKTRKEGKILENKVPSFMFAPPISATALVENTGNVHVDAEYILQVSNFFGGEEVYSNEESPEVRTVLPETRRLNTISWDGAPHLGIFKVKQTVKFLGETKTTEKLVFICPIWLLFIILAIIFLIIFLIVNRAIKGGRKE